MKRRSIRALAGPCLASVLCAATAAYGGVIYRWVDEQGKTHFSDVVPEKYRRVARPVGGSDEAPPPAPPASRPAPRPLEQAASTPGAASAAPAAPAAPVRRPPSTPSALASGKRPASTPTEGTDCATWLRLYRESLDCFAPFVTARGAMKAEAFAVCNPVPEPPIRCGRMAQ